MDDDGHADLMRRGRQLRQDAGLSLDLVAGQCNVTASAVSRWEIRGPGPVAAGGDQVRRWVAILAVLDATAPPGAR
jgi:transcriptional regulator with XRE-family HTH domain